MVYGTFFAFLEIIEKYRRVQKALFVEIIELFLRNHCVHLAWAIWTKKSDHTTTYSIGDIVDHIEKLKKRERKLSPPMTLKNTYTFEFGKSNRFICEIWNVDGLNVFEFRDKAKPHDYWKQSNNDYYVWTAKTIEDAAQQMNKLLAVEEFGTYNLGF